VLFTFTFAVVSPLHAAVVTADDRHAPLDLLHANENDLATDEEYNNKVKRQCLGKSHTPPKNTDKLIFLCHRLL